MQYFNPYYQQPMPMQQQYNPLQPQYERLAQMQAQYNQPTYAQQPSLNGEIVDSIDVVRAKNVDMSGNPTFYPKSDMTEIYTKQLQSDGTSCIVTYRAVQPEESKPEQVKQYVDIQTLNTMLGQLKSEILQGVGGGLSELKQIMMPPEPQTSKRQRGGNQND